MTLFILCVKIFFARILDVSLATFVTVLTVKGEKLKATIIGFIDVMIWFLVVKEALNTNLNSIWIALSYASGYAFGTYIGSTLSNLFIQGKISIQVILDKENEKDIDIIRNNGYAVSEINCKGKNNVPKIMLFIEADNKHLNDVKKIINNINNNAFIIVNETKFVENGFFK